MVNGLRNYTNWAIMYPFKMVKARNMAKAMLRKKRANYQPEFRWALSLPKANWEKRQTKVQRSGT